MTGGLSPLSGVSYMLSEWQFSGIDEFKKLKNMKIEVDKMEIGVSHEGDIYEVRYFYRGKVGIVDYKLFKLTGYVQPGNVFIMTNSSMGEIIEGINEVTEGGIREGDLDGIRKWVRDDSLRRVTEYGEMVSPPVRSNY